MRLWRGLDKRLQGWPDTVVTSVIVMLAITATVLAFTAPRPLKLVVLGWMIAP